MIRRPPRSTRTDTLFPYTTLFRSLCDIRLVDDANYPWLIVVPRVVDACELFDLDSRQRGALIEEIVCAEQALKALFTPDKLNVAALGNAVRTLPVHVIARHTNAPSSTEERRVGKECVRTSSSRWSPSH